jgi:transposase-like protein
MSHLIFEIKKLNKGKHGTLLFHNYLYTLKRDNTKEASQNWSCKKCKSTLTTKDQSVTRICGVDVDHMNEVDVRKMLKKNHSHQPSNEVAIQINQAMQSLKEILKSDTNSESVQSLYRRKQSELITSGITIKQLISNGFPQYDEIKSTLYKNRQKNFPSIPSSRDDSIINQSDRFCNRQARVKNCFFHYAQVKYFVLVK